LKILEWKTLEYFMANWYFYGHLVCVCLVGMIDFVIIKYVVSNFRILYQEKSGSPVSDNSLRKPANAVSAQLKPT
jgi:hypothetical protein